MKHNFSNLFYLLVPAFCLLLFSVCLLPSTSCKKPTEPPDVRIDTTSHDFVFEIDTLGNGSSSVLNDVCIIAENDIWAVGEIYVQDTTGQSEELYNAVHWDGNRWNLVKVPVQDFGGLIATIPLRTILGFASNDVWVASSGSLIRWNGSLWSEKAFFVTDLSFNGQVLKMWGTSGSNIYCVGRNGVIYYFDGSNWQKLSSGTTVDIQDIWGEGQTVLAVASFLNYGRGLDLLQIQGTSVTKLDTTGLHISLNSIWFESGQRFYITGNGVYSKKTLDDLRWQNDDTHPLLYKDRIRGNRWNDVWISGSGGLMSHYNGATWKHYTGTELPRVYARYQGLSVKRDVVVAVGWMNDQAVIVRGRRR
jgi:hypothetical protein